ncbi:MAG: hypothetical protein HY923_08960 [Elusimicrobia bacterium]|nr:hypothetical protein [Elusimicrobiota bacterium]
MIAKSAPIKFLMMAPFGLALILTEPTRASTTSVFDVLVATDNLTVVGTTTIQGNGFSVGASTLVIKNGNVGIGTTTPVGPLQVVGSADSQLLLFTAPPAFRAGGNTGNYWDPAKFGAYSVAFGMDNQAIGYAPAIGGGRLNETDGDFTVVSGGDNNEATAQSASVGGGEANLAAGPYSHVGGGYVNTSSESWSVVSGGYVNFAIGLFSSVGGGSGNIADHDYATVGGGGANHAKGIGATISGGIYNLATGQYSTIPGGYANIASGDYAFAAGSRSSATAAGSFVWSDTQSSAFISNLQDEFKARAKGGFVLYSSSTTPTVVVSSGAIMISTSATAASAVPNLFISSTNGNVGIGTKSPATALDVNGAVTASSASLTATGSNIYSLTSSSGIHILAGGITWPDGTTSVSSASSSGASFANEWQWVADTVAVNDVGVGFSNLTSSVAYRIEIDIIANTATSKLVLTFNGDTATNYSYSYLSESDTNAQLNAGGVGQTSITLCADSSSVGGEFHGDVDFATAYSLPKKVMVKSMWTYLSTTAILNGHSGGRYVGSSTLSSAKISIGSGTMKGVVKLFKRNGTAW